MILCSFPSYCLTNSRTNLENTNRHAGAPPLMPLTVPSMVPQAGARGTGPSEIGFDYASRVKPGKATWQRGFRLKDEEYRANMVYLKKRLQRSRDIEWDDHMKTNTNTQAIDQIVYDFKAKFRSFWDTILSEPWVDWALRGMVLTEVRRM